MVFAAGRGTRLGELTQNVPKPLLPVAGVPILGHVIFSLAALGIERVVVNVGYLGSQVERYLRALPAAIIPEILISKEAGQLLDTGGGLKQAAPLFTPGEPILVHNGDMLIDGNTLSAFLDRARPKECFAELLCSDNSDQRRFLFRGDRCLLCGWENRTTGKRKLIGTTTSDIQSLGFSGIHILSSKALVKVYEFQKEVFSLVELYLAEASDGKQIRAEIAAPGKWLDIGTPEDFGRADSFILAHPLMSRAKS